MAGTEAAVENTEAFAAGVACAMAAGVLGGDPSRSGSGPGADASSESLTADPLPDVASTGGGG